MKKIIAIFIPLFFFLLIIGNVKGATLNFTTYNLTEIPVSVTPDYWVWQTEVMWDTAEQEWLFHYGLATSGGQSTPYLCRFDDDFTTLLDGCDSLVPASATTPKGQDFYDYNRTHLVYIAEEGTTEKVYTYYIKKSDLSKTVLNSPTVNENNKNDLKFSSNDNNSFVFFDHTGDHYFCFGNGTCAEIFINAIHTNPTDLQWVYVPDTDEYYMFYVQNDSETTGKAYLNIYDASKDDEGVAGYQPDFKGWFQVSVGAIIPNEKDESGTRGWQGTTQYPQGSIYAKYINGFVYWISRTRTLARGNSNQTYYFEAIDPVGTRDHSWLHLIKGSGEYINLTAYDSNLCEVQNYTIVLDQCANSSQGISFEYVEENDQWWIFYHRYNMSNVPSSTTAGYGYELMALTSTSQCRCSDWYNVSSCGDQVSGLQKQLRSCNPDLCDDEIRYIDCVEVAPEVNVEKRFECCICTDEWRNPAEEGTSRCSCSIQIPEDCTAGTIFANSTLTTDIDYWVLWEYSDIDAFYVPILCNPPDNCAVLSEFHCSQTNVTQTLDYADYQAGDTAQADFGITQAMNCKKRRSWLYEYGWNKYRVSGELCYYCDRTCGGSICITRGFNDYKVQQLPDCTINETSKELCSYGCLNGECLTEIAETERGLRSPSGNPFEWILGEASYNLGSTVTMAFAFGISLAGGIYGTIATKKWQIGAIAIMGLVALFMSIGWLPAIIGILWILSIALILMKGIFFKGD